MNSALEDLKALMRDAEQILASTGDAADDQVAELHERLQQAMEQSRARLGAFQSAAQEHLQECDAYVRSHPYQSAGVALAVGALLGMLVTRR